MRRTWTAAAALALAAALAACAYRPVSEHPLITDPDGTVDTTHGAKGSQTSPR